MTREVARLLRDLPDWELTLLHTKPLGFRPAIPRSVRKRSHVRLARRPEQRAAALAEAAIFVPAPDGEARLTLEAAASGVAIAEGGDDPDRVTLEVSRLAEDKELRDRAAARGRQGAERQSFDLVAKELATLYTRLSGKRRDGPQPTAADDPLEGRDWVVVDLHMHTDWSHDCSTPVTDLLDHAEEIGLEGIAITDHNVFGGALEAVELARDRELIVIPGEEVKTDGQGEVIGLFLEEEIPRGMSFGDTIEAIREQGGLVYLPHPSTGCTPSPTRRPCIGTSRRSTSSRSSTRAFCATRSTTRRSASRESIACSRARAPMPMCCRASGRALQDAALRRGGGVPALAPHGRSAAPSQVARVLAVAQVGRASQGKGPVTEKGCPDPVPTALPTDEIYERYLKKAIAEINELGDELARTGDELRVPVVGSGHPLADVLLLKYLPLPPEIQEGVAFFGRSGQAVLKSLQRLHVDPLAVYGTNCLKFGTEDPADAAAWLTREIHIVQPKLMIVMGERSVAFVNDLGFLLSDPLDANALGELQRFTPTIEALVTPDIDESLDDQSAKTGFWNAFKALGPWWSGQPPY